MRQFLPAPLLSAFVSFGSAHAQGKAEGALTFNGKSIPLAHAYVVLHTNEEKLLDGQELRILLTDKEVDAKVLARPVLSQLDALARDGAFQGILLRYDPVASEREVHGTVYAALDDPQMSMPFFTLSGGDAGFLSLNYTPQEMSAEVEHDGGESSFEDMPAYSYKAIYSAPVQTIPGLSASLEGKEAQDSPQAQAALNLERAMREGKLDEAKTFCTPARIKDLEEFLQQVGEDEFKKQAATFIPDPRTRAKQIKNVFVRDTTAIVIFDEEGGTSSVDLVKIGDAWKLD